MDLGDPPARSKKIHCSPTTLDEPYIVLVLLVGPRFQPIGKIPTLPAQKGYIFLAVPPSCMILVRLAPANELLALGNNKSSHNDERTPICLQKS